MSDNDYNVLESIKMNRKLNYFVILTEIFVYYNVKKLKKILVIELKKLL